jgi:hypothetical protein
MRKLHFRLSSALSLLLFCLQLALATLPLEHLSQLLHSFPSKLFSVFIPDVEEKLRVDRKKNSSQVATHGSIFGRA